MPLSYSIMRGGSLVYSLGHGTITSEDILAHTCLLAEDEDIDLGASELVDLRVVSGVRLSPEAFKSIVAHSKLYLDRFRGWRCAIVAQNELLLGWSKTYTEFREALGAPGRIRVFRDIREACEWLGIASHSELDLQDEL